MQHVLIVDDEVGTRQVLKLYLERSGLEVTTAASLAEAISCADARPPDLLLCDWRLGDGSSGLDVIRALRAQREKLAVLVMTGLAGADLIEQLQRIGLDERHVIAKPFRASDLLVRIRASIE